MPKTLYPILTYAGALPFWGCALCLSLGITELPVLGSVVFVLQSYTVVIGSFMAGAHWGQHLEAPQGFGAWLGVISNVFALVLWMGAIVLGVGAFLGLSIAVFLALLAVDQRLLRASLISAHYFRVRVFVTALVVLSLVLSMITL